MFVLEYLSVILSFLSLLLVARGPRKKIVSGRNRTHNFGLPGFLVARELPDVLTIRLPKHQITGTDKAS